MKSPAVLETYTGAPTVKLKVLDLIIPLNKQSTATPDTLVATPNKFFVDDKSASASSQLPELFKAHNSN